MGTDSLGLGPGALGRSALDRHAELRNDQSWWREASVSADTQVLLVNGPAVPIVNDALAFVPASDVADLPKALLGSFNGVIYASALADSESDDTWQSLRSCGAELSDRDSDIATTAVALANWHRTHTHCPRCGAETFITTAGWVRQCPADGSEHYPRTDAAIITMITDADDRLLLARQVVWQPAHFSVVAGFVEPGETYETAVKREVFEETGIRVANVEYLASQPWPFPASIMVGMRATALNTDIAVDGSEIAEARWLSREDMKQACTAGEVQLPPRVSIARRLIEFWFGEPIPDSWTRR